MPVRASHSEAEIPGLRQLFDASRKDVSLVVKVEIDVGAIMAVAVEDMMMVGNVDLWEAV